MPLEDRPRSRWIVGAAIETMVWSMKVIATAKIIAVRIRLRDRPPMLLIVDLPALAPLRLSLSTEGPDAETQSKFAHDKLGMGRELCGVMTEVIAVRRWTPVWLAMAVAVFVAGVATTTWAPRSARSSCLARRRRVRR